MVLARCVELPLPSSLIRDRGVFLDNAGEEDVGAHLCMCVSEGEKARERAGWRDGGRETEIRQNRGMGIEAER